MLVCVSYFLCEINVSIYKIIFIIVRIKANNVGHMQKQKYSSVLAGVF